MVDAAYIRSCVFRIDNDKLSIVKSLLVAFPEADDISLAAEGDDKQTARSHHPMHFSEPRLL